MGDMALEQISPAPEAPVPPRSASTVITLRDTSGGPEVLMVRRSDSVSFMAGALVFPGGRVETTDGLDGDTAVFGQARRMAGLRELFEEAAILAACDVRTGDPVAPLRAAELAHRWRTAVAAGEIGFGELLAREGLTADVERLQPLANWVTPAGSPRRFDTAFFMLRAPAGQEGVHDGRELVDSCWIRPDAALALRETNQALIVPVTFANLSLLIGHRDVAALLCALAGRPLDPIHPKRVSMDGDSHIFIPAEAGYGFTTIRTPAGIVR